MEIKIIIGGKNIGLLPYIHTNSVGVILQMNGNALQVQAQTSNFAGTYQVAGLLIYTKVAGN